MTTQDKSREAFDKAMAASMDKSERGACLIAWREGIAYGRKVALEEVISEVQVFESGGSNFSAFAVRIGNKIKELLK
jgi:hypothetical protein